MANPQQLKILKEEGVQAWNSWREENPEIKPNLSNTNLKYKKFREANFKNTNFSNAKIQGTDFSNAKLDNANFSNAKTGLKIYWQFVVIFPVILLPYIGGYLSRQTTKSLSNLVYGIYNYGQIPYIFTALLVIVFAAFFYFSYSRRLLAGIIAISIMVVIGIGLIAAISGYLTSSITDNLVQQFLSLIIALPFEVCLVAISVSMIVMYTGYWFLGFIPIFIALFVEKIASLLGLLLWVIPVFILSKLGFISQPIKLPPINPNPQTIDLLREQFLQRQLAGMANTLGTMPLFVFGFLNIIIILFSAYVGWKALFGDDKFTFIRSLAINFVCIGGTKFYNASLINANFSEATLKNSNFRKADVIGVQWYDSKELNLSRIDDLILRKRKVRELLTTKNGENISYADEDLTGANLQGANLEGANLSRTKLYDANLSGSFLTGACIENWNIDKDTDIQGINCRYIYLCEKPKNNEDYSERRPHGTDFQKGDFSKIFSEVRETVDLIFTNGIEWQSFLKSFQDLQVEGTNGQLEIQAIERKTGGAFLVRVEVPPDASKADIEASFWSKYNPLLEAKDKEIKLLSQQTEFYSREIEVIREGNTKLLGIVETMAEKENIRVQQNIYAPVTGLAGNVEGNQNIFTSQSISQASTEIQNLLTTLQNNGLTQEQAEEKVADNLATQAKDNPTFKSKLVNWGTSLGNKAAETSVSEIARRVIKLALNLAGVPFP